MSIPGAGASPEEVTPSRSEDPFKELVDEILAELDYTIEALTKMNRARLKAVPPLPEGIYAPEHGK